MNGNHRRLVPVLSAAVLGLTACSSGTGGPAGATTVELQADYPAYDVPTLVEDASLVVEGTVLGTGSTVLRPRFEGDTPQENPILGMSEQEKEEAIEQDAGIAATAVTVRVDVAHRGAVRPGGEITVVQTGGVVDGVRYEVPGEALLATGTRYLLFAAAGADGTFVILGGSAGTYVADGDDSFTAAVPDLAPAAGFTTSEVGALLG